MKKLTVAIVLTAAAVAGCAPVPYNRGGQYGYIENGVYYADRSPYHGGYWDRYYYGPRYY